MGRVFLFGRLRLLLLPVAFFLLALLQLLGLLIVPLLQLLLLLLMTLLQVLPVLCVGVALFQLLLFLRLPLPHTLAFRVLLPTQIVLFTLLLF